MRSYRVKAILLGAGHGTRLQPLTFATPKILIEMVGVPLLWHWAGCFMRSGVTDIVVNTHHLRQSVVSALEYLNRLDGPRWHEFYESHLLGSARTISQCHEWIDGADIGLIIYGDNFPSIELSDFLDAHWGSGSDITIGAFQASNPSACGVVTVDENMRALSFVEKPNEPEGNLAFAGLIAVTDSGWKEIAVAGGHDLAADVLPRFINRMTVWQCPKPWFDIGTYAGLFAARRYAEANGAAEKLPACLHPDRLQETLMRSFDRTGSRQEKWGP